jgi:hypothetical protein
VTRVWVEDNIGNIQNSDIRHISEKCYEWISGWPAVRLDHEAFLDQVHRCLGIPEGIRILKRAFHPKAARKRSVFEPVVERVTALLERTDKEEWRKIRAKPADEVAEFVAAFLRDHDEFELLQEIIFVDLGRGCMMCRGLKNFRSSQKRSRSRKQQILMKNTTPTVILIPLSTRQLTVVNWLHS